MTIEAADMIPSRCLRARLQRRAFLAGVSASAFAAAGPLTAADAVSPEFGWQQLKLDYDVTAAGVGVARAAYRARLDGRHLGSELKVKNTGAASWFNDVTSTMNGQARLIERPDGTIALLPVTFQSRHENAGGERTVTIDYDDAGQITTLDYRRDGRTRDSKVPTELWQDTVDPLTGIASIWHQVRRRNGQDNTFDHAPIPDLAVFDGRKRYDVHIDPQQLDAAGNPLGSRAIQVSARRTPIAGYDADDDEWRRHLEGNPPVMQFFATADGRAIPYLALNPVDAIEQQATLSRYCLNGDCRTIPT